MSRSTAIARPKGRDPGAGGLARRASPRSLQGFPRAQRRKDRRGALRQHRLPQARVRGPTRRPTIVPSIRQHALILPAPVSLSTSCSWRPLRSAAPRGQTCHSHEPVWPTGQVFRPAKVSLTKRHHLADSISAARSRRRPIALGDGNAPSSFTGHPRWSIGAAPSPSQTSAAPSSGRASPATRVGPLQRSLPSAPWFARSSRTANL